MPMDDAKKPKTRVKLREIINHIYKHFQTELLQHSVNRDQCSNLPVILSSFNIAKEKKEKGRKGVDQA